MAKHEELLREGPRYAPEPETAEQRSRRQLMDKPPRQAPEPANQW